MAVNKAPNIETATNNAVSDADFADAMAALPLSEGVHALAIAISGGADSMALAWLAHRWAASRHITLYALTVDHGIRPEAAKEARQVGQWMAEWELEHHILTHQQTLDTANLQAQARDVRYGMMANWCHQHGVEHLLLAHHEDDQAETFLIRLGRGSGVDGLAAMQPHSQHYGLTLLRPLLRTAKAQLIATLESMGQPWLEDPSNQNPAFTRTHMRQLLEPLAEAGITPSKLADTAERMARAQSFLEDTAHAAFASLLAPVDSATLHLNRTGFAALHPEIAHRVLALALQSLTGEAYRPRFEKLTLLYDALVDLKKPVKRTLAHCQFTSHMDGRVEIAHARA